MKTLLSTIALTTLFISQAHGRPMDLLQAYQLAAKHDATLQNAKQTYLAARLNAPIAFAPILPQVSVTGDTTWTKPVKPEAPGSNTHQYALSITQSLFNLSNWMTFDKALSQLKIDAMTYATAQQNLITTVATNYFSVLNANENLRYANANLASLKKQLEQTEQQHDVGLVAITDVQSTRAQYETAIATQVANKNTLENSKQTLAVNVGQAVDQVVPLEKDFPLLKPQPSDPDAWVKLAERQNLSVLTAQKQLSLDQAGVKVDWSQYMPTASAVATQTKSWDSTGTPGTTRTAALDFKYAPFTGGSTYYSVKKDHLTVQADAFALKNTRRVTASTMRQNYSTILSDISQIKAYKQSVISGEAALKANQAAYRAGTMTIVDVLTQQSSLFQSQQQYANATYTYITDTLALKQEAGSLNVKDLRNINTWLGKAKPASKESKS